MAGKRRHRTKTELRRDQALRQFRKAGSRVVASVASRLESPQPDADLVGEQEHFLRRIERLPPEAQGLAVRLYYSFELRRFVARDALRVPISVIGHEAEPDDLAERRVVVAIEPGPTPARLIFDGRGKAITCLAPDMAVGSGTRVSFEEFEASVRHFGEWQSAHARAREAVASTDIVCRVLDLKHEGWLAPREEIERLGELGPAAGVFILCELRDGLKAATKALVRSATPGPLDDARLREWFAICGQCGAFLSLLVEWGVEPDLRFSLRYLTIAEPVISMMLGACLAFWRPDDGDDLVREVFEADAGADLKFSYEAALRMYYGMLRRIHFKLGCPRDEALDDIEGALDRSRDEDEERLAERRRLGLPEDSIIVFGRDLALLARGGRPDWGDDLADDPDALPPLRLDDLCLPGCETSPRALRFLAQRLFAGLERPMWDMFLPSASLEQWRERLGPLDVVRAGDFSPPWVLPPDRPPPVRRGLPGRNEPCPCGSGKKFKKCCLPKVEAGGDVG